MAREPNLISTRQLTVSTTEQVAPYLADLAKTGVWGKNAAEAAERLIADQIRRLINEGVLKIRGGKNE